MENVRIIETTADTIMNYAMCGYKNPKHEGYRRKIDWLAERFEEGLQYKILKSEEDGDIGGIEYIPGKYSWRAIKADGFMVIHCIYIMSRKYKEQGYGQKLLDSCIEDARDKGMDGVAVVTRKGTWMAGEELFLSKGFQVVDRQKPDFKLLVLIFNADAPLPSFTVVSDEDMEQYLKGLTMLCSDQCPYTAKAQKEIAEVAEDEYGIKLNLVNINDPVDAQNSPCVFGSFCMLYEGLVIADHPISKTRFKNIMNKLMKNHKKTRDF